MKSKIKKILISAFLLLILSGCSIPRCRPYSNGGGVGPFSGTAHLVATHGKHGEIRVCYAQ